MLQFEEINIPLDTVEGGTAQESSPAPATQARPKRRQRPRLRKQRTPAQRVALARSPERPNVHAYIANLFQGFFELHGDRGGGDDGSVVGGIAYFEGVPVTVVGHCKGKNLEENIRCNFGMPGPEGYRKALRLMKQAEKFRRPIITFVDTPGAYPGIEAEEHGQGEAIARSLMEMSRLQTPIITVVIGEGGSGGALALSIANTIIMLENAVYSILSPEGFASILWKDSGRAGEACDLMKLTAKDLYDFGIADYLVGEPSEGIARNPKGVYAAIARLIHKELARLNALEGTALTEERYQKFREIGRATASSQEE